MKIILKTLTALVSICVAGGLGWMIYNQSVELVAKEVPPVKKQPVAVEVMPVAQRVIADRAELVGSLMAGSEVQILARRDGYITDIPFDVGDTIARGEVIVVLDDREQVELVAGAKAALVVAEAQKRAQDAQEELAESIYNRNKRLRDRNAATEEEFTQAEAQWRIAVAQRELEEARVKQAQSEIDRTTLALTDSKILAPMSGVVAERMVDVGDLAKPDVPLLRIVSYRKVHTVVHVVEKDYPRVKVGQQATIQVDAFPHQEFSGKVIRKAPVLNPGTRTAAVEIEIPNPDLQLKPGMHARVSLIFVEREATVLPMAAITKKDDKPAVLVLNRPKDGENPTVRVQEIVTGIEDGELTEVISGVAPDEQIVTLGVRVVKNGQEVLPVEIAWSKPPKVVVDQTEPESSDSDSVSTASE
ncbi:efflux RND transporter periplasmic adaptor subunit [Thalassoroseus pseudoceratinae]|uniref:efflux RND transporter periplasmic adaptor subunit n=1 Tax=Thalassoroseus pseudoceratinae TaxID=2713176 RepID=UPI00141EC44A|nr:efflux RND transporter periplasmic adaptor subunit [Thalassoroseus pseudoceratinae]